MTVELASDLLACLHEFGARHSNPVLAVLDGQQPVTEVKYPAEFIRFGNDQLRAFYHCHTTHEKDEAEHGHFHIFTRCHDTDTHVAWAHVAGLSMSHLGQPLTWFTVNQWVTGDIWLSTSQLSARLSALDPTAHHTTVGHWLGVILKLYASDLLELYRSRDTQISRLCETRPQSEVFADRTIYYLSHSPINLQQTLVELLSHHPATHSRGQMDCQTIGGTP